MIRQSIALLLALGLAWPALAGDPSSRLIEVTDPWVRAAPPGATTGAAYVILSNRGRAEDRLMGGATAAATRLEVHEMSISNGVMQMRQVSHGLPLPPGGTVRLAPGGFHLMLIGLQRPLKVGDHVRAKLRFQRAGVIEIDFMVRPAPRLGTLR